MRFTLCSSNAKEAETREDYFYARPVRRFGGAVRQNSVPGHIHARRGGAENQPAGVASPGESKTLDLDEQTAIRAPFNGTVTSTHQGNHKCVKWFVYIYL